MDVGRRLREIRTRRGLVIDDIADASGLSRAYISQVETGKASPSLQALAKLAAAVDIPVAALFVAEDSAFMHNCMKIIGQNYIQFVVKNVWKVHNRSHPDKRKYIKDEDIKVRTLQNAGKWYNELCRLSKENLAMLDHPQNKFHTFEYYNKIMDEE